MHYKSSRLVYHSNSNVKRNVLVYDTMNEDICERIDSFVTVL